MSKHVVCEQVRYPEALNYFLSADVKAIKKTLKKPKPVHRMASCFMRMQKVRLMPAFVILNDCYLAVIGLLYKAC